MKLRFLLLSLTLLPMTSLLGKSAAAALPRTAEEVDTKATQGAAAYVKRSAAAVASAPSNKWDAMLYEICKKLSTPEEDFEAQYVRLKQLITPKNCTDACMAALPCRHMHTQFNKLIQDLLGDFDKVESDCLRKWIDAHRAPSALTTTHCTDACMAELEKDLSCSHMLQKLLKKLKETLQRLHSQHVEINIYNSEATITASPEQVEKAIAAIAGMPPELASIVADYLDPEPIMQATIRYAGSSETGETIEHFATYNLNTDELVIDAPHYYYRYLVPSCCTLHMRQRPVQWRLEYPVDGDQLPELRNHAITTSKCPGVDTCVECKRRIHLFVYDPQDAAALNELFTQIALQQTGSLDQQTKLPHAIVQAVCGNIKCQHALQVSSACKLNTVPRLKRLREEGEAGNPIAPDGTPKSQK